MTTGTGLSPGHDLDLAMCVAADVHRVVAAADSKAGLLLATQGVVLAATAGPLRPGATAAVSRGGGTAVLFLAVLTVLCLLAVLWPRTGGPAPQWIAFTALHRRGTFPPRPDESTLAEQAWAQAVALAAIAHRKHAWFRASLILAIVEVTGFVVWVTLGAGHASTT